MAGSSSRSVACPSTQRHPPVPSGRRNSVGTWAQSPALRLPPRPEGGGAVVGVDHLEQGAVHELLDGDSHERSHRRAHIRQRPVGVEHAPRRSAQGSERAELVVRRRVAPVGADHRVDDVLVGSSAHCVPRVLDVPCVTSPVGLRVRRQGPPSNRHRPPASTVRRRESGHSAHPLGSPSLISGPKTLPRLVPGCDAQAQEDPPRIHPLPEPGGVHGHQQMPSGSSPAPPPSAPRRRRGHGRAPVGRLRWEWRHLVEHRFDRGAGAARVPAGRPRPGHPAGQRRGVALPHRQAEPDARRAGGGVQRLPAPGPRPGRERGRHRRGADAQVHRRGPVA